MYIGKNVVGAGANIMILLAAMFALYLLDGESWWGFGWDLVTYGTVLFLAFMLSYFSLRRLDQIYARRPQTRVDRFLTTLDDAELDALRNRMSGGRITDGEYGSIDHLLIENEVKSKRR
jgi:hypothetical protein